VPTRKTTKQKPTKKATPQRASAKPTAKQRPSAKSKAPANRQAKDDSATSKKEVTIDRRRGERREDEVAQAAEPKLERRKKVNRRRQIDPTTCERDYSDQEVEFMNALDDYKRSSGRMFPTCSEVLEVIRGLGYVKLSPAELAARGDSADEPAAELACDDAEAEVVAAAD
jgi:hypothetical protein